MSTPGKAAYIRDTLTYTLGSLIILKQAGIFFPAPESVSIELVALGALCCNVPGILQVIAWRSGQSSTALPPSQPEERPSQPAP